MNRSWPLRLVLASLWLCLSAAIAAGQVPSAVPAAISAAVHDKPASDHSIYSPDGSSIPADMLNLMQASRSKYLEGSNLIRAGDADSAREAFDEAVDMLIRSDWDLTSTPTLHRFFQDLIQRIQEDESRYLLVQYDEETGEEIENAVVDDLNEVDLASLIADPSLREILTAELAENKYDIPITINEMVVKSLDYWLNRGRQYFIDGLQRSGQYRPIIERVFREESIPLDLMYLAQVESLFKTHAVSRAKAKGIWQFEKATAIRYGLKVTRDVDERSDPEKSTRAAARYLKDLYKMFEDWDLALAAYNWGEGKVQRLIKSTGLSDFWQLADLRRKLPQETKNHVPLIQASVILAKNPEKYGLPVQLDPPLEYVKVSVSKPIDLRAAAKVLSLPIDELKKLNPALRGFTTPANYPNFQLKVPAGVDSSVHDQLAALPRAKSTPVQTSGSRHKVRPGETLSGIAARYRVSIAAIEKANNISAKKKLIAGKSLIIPAATAKAQTAKQTAGSSKATKAAAGKSGGQKGTGNAAEKSRISPSQPANPIAKTAASDKGRARETASKQAVSR